MEELLDQREADERPELRPGASNKDLKQLEDKLGKKLPKEFRESYRIHDGQVPGVDLVPAVSPDDEQYEVTARRYTAFLNAVAATDTYGLYSTEMTSTFGCQIVRNGSSGSYTYSVAWRGPTARIDR